MLMNQIDMAGSEGRGRFVLATRIIIALVLLFLISLPQYLGERYVMIFLLIMLYMALGQMWNLLGGYTGLVSLGQQIFIGLGGYSLAVMTELYQFGFYWGILVGGVISVLFALSFPSRFQDEGRLFHDWKLDHRRTAGLFFVNWNTSGTGWASTSPLPTTCPLPILYYVALVIGVGSVVLVYTVMRTKEGWP
jgi:branched-chain amino acid transport system permease protein